MNLLSNYRLSALLPLFAFFVMLSCNSDKINEVYDPVITLKESKSYYDFRVELTKYNDITIGALIKLNEADKKKLEIITEKISKEGFANISSDEKNDYAIYNGYSNYSELNKAINSIVEKRESFKKANPELSNIPTETHLSLDLFFAEKMKENKEPFKILDITLKHKQKVQTKEQSQEKLDVAPSTGIDNYDLCLMGAVANYEISLLRCMIVSEIAGPFYFVDCTASAGASFNLAANVCHQTYGTLNLY